MPNILVERLRVLPIHRTSEVWEVAASPLPAMAPMEEGGRPEQLVACVCVSSAGGAAMAPPQTARTFSTSAPLDALAKFALSPLLPEAKPRNYLPARVHVGPMPAEAQHEIVSALTELGVIVELKDDVELAAEFFLGFAAHLAGLSGGGATLVVAPALLGVKGLPVERIAAFADAAQAFWKAAPWRHSKSEIVWRIEPVPKSRPFRHCTVMGAAGQEFGLAFLADPMQMMAMAAADHPADYFENTDGTHWCVTFDRADNIPPADALLWKDHKLALSGPNAFPLPMGVTKAGRIQRPTPANLTLMEGLLRAFASLKRTEAKADVFTREVTTFDGPQTFTLTAMMKME